MCVSPHLGASCNMGLFRRHATMGMVGKFHFHSPHASNDKHDTASGDFYWRSNRTDKRNLAAQQFVAGHDWLIQRLYFQRNSLIGNAVKAILSNPISPLDNEGWKNAFVCRPYTGRKYLDILQKNCQHHVVDYGVFQRYLRG